MGLGDEIMAAGRAKVIFDRFNTAVAIVDNNNMTRNHPVWERNPAIDSNSVVKLKDGPGHRGYIKQWKGGRSVFNMDYCNRDHPGRIYPPDELREWAKQNIPNDCIIIEPIVKRPSSLGKDWGFNKWADVARILNSLTDKPIIQLSNNLACKTLPFASLINTPTFWHAAVAIERSFIVLTPEGGMHHMAGALNKSAIVIFGGFVHPNITGYSNHINLYVDIEGSPCGNYNTCGHCKKALSMITVDNVISKVKEIYNASG